MNIIQEMVGRIGRSQQNLWKDIKIRFRWGAEIESQKYERSDYDLTKAIYYASAIVGEDGNTKGAEYLLGAVFGKRIVNAVTAFGFSQMPNISFKNAPSKVVENANEFVNNWFEENRKEIIKTIKYCIRDGDAFPKLKDDLTIFRISPNRIEIETDPLKDGKIKKIIKTVSVDENDKTFIYETEYTETYPYEITYKYEAGDEKNKVQYSMVNLETEVDTEKSDEGNAETAVLKPLPIVPFHNDKEDDYVYGTSEYQNVYHVMANYHAVLAESVKNNIFNSGAKPYISGVENIQAFLEANGDKNDSGEYELNWETVDSWVGGTGFDIRMIRGADNAKEAQTLLEILFYLICQGSETPEFVMGTAVSSSKASVSEQMPVMLQKAEMKRTEFTEYFRDLVKLLVIKARELGEDLPENPEFDLKFPPMVNNDKKLNLDIIKALSEEGVITDRTKLMLADLDIVDSVDDEIEQARAEAKEKNEAYGNFGVNDQDRIDKEIEDLDEESE